MPLANTVKGALRAQWRASTMRRLLRSALRWHTALLLERIDSDAEELRELQRQIPRVLRALAEDKAALLAQASELSDGYCPPTVPSNIQQVTASRGGWSPSRALPAGPLFTSSKRTPKQ